MKNPAPTHITPAQDRVPLPQKAAYASGVVASCYLTNTISVLALPIYNIALGVHPMTISLALGLPRFLDAIIDPFIGNISDNTRTRWGRRRPFIAGGVMVASLLFALMWLPPAHADVTVLGIYFTVICVLTFLAISIFQIPYDALGMELSQDYNERTRVQAWKMTFYYVFSFLTPWTYALCLLPVFGGSEVVGARFVGVGVALVAMISGLISAAFCRERAETQKQEKIKFLPAFRCTLKNRAFLILTGVMIIVLCGFYLSMPFMTYVNIYYVCGGDKAFGAKMSGIYGTVQAATGFVAVPAITWLSTRFGKKKMMLGGQGLALLGCLSGLVCITPQHPYLQLVVPVLISAGSTCLFLLSGSSLADVCDLDELNTGLRREGMYGAVGAFALKLGSAAVTSISGIMLMVAGYSGSAEALTPQTLVNMRNLYALVPAAGLALALVLMAFYPITEKAAHATRLLLEERRKQASPDHSDNLADSSL
jgi:GPH family glycoside/pentoside/hexuronide:cation symporter